MTVTQYYLDVLRRWMRDRESVSPMNIHYAVVYLKDKGRPEFIPEDIWKKLISEY